MKLYDSLLAPNPRRVRWVMAEKGVEGIEVVSLDIMAGEHRAADYLAGAGLPHVPMLQLDDGTCLTESIAICRYLEARWPQPNLFGRTPQEAAEIEMWMRRAEMLFANPLMMSVRLSFPPLAVLEPPNPAVADYFQAAARRGVEVLNARLQGRDWIVADRLTIADIVAIAALDFARLIRFRVPEDAPDLARWAAAMRARPAAAAGMPPRKQG